MAKKTKKIKKRKKAVREAVAILEKTSSICPTCQSVIPATIIEKGGKAIMQKNCEKHGKFEEVCYDADEYKKAMKFMKYVEDSEKGCNFSCKGYDKHMTETCLAVIDLTNRCNLRCSYCFANSAVSNKIYEPSSQQIKDTITFLRKAQPRCNAILFSGGEPTLRDDLFEILDHARKEKFDCLMIATNGIKMAYDLDYVKEAAKHKLGLLYLSFDGLDDNTNKEKRNHLVINQLLDNCRKAGLGVVLVPTVIRGQNEHTLFEIIKFAAKNVDVIKGINFQPVGFTGRMSAKERKKQRYNIPDLCKDIEKQSNGKIKASDFYPVTAAVPLSNLLEVISGQKIIRFSMHPICGSATYLYIDNGEIVPISEFLRVDEFLNLCDKYTNEIKEKKWFFRTLATMKMIKDLPSMAGNRKVELINLLINLIIKKDYEALTKFHQKALFVGAMHFQDPYNMNFERLKRCGVHYITPDKQIIPFCAYNNLGYREAIEGKHSKCAYSNLGYEERAAGI
ncbi:MAG: radical SAM protein [Candidatus Micrarchaeia archaeon]